MPLPMSLKNVIEKAREKQTELKNNKPADVICKDCRNKCKSVFIDFVGWKTFCNYCEAKQQQKLHQENEVKRIQREIQSAGLKGNLSFYTFANFKADKYEKQLDLISKVLKNQNQRKGLFLYGPPGSGKTHLVCAITNKIITENLGSVKFIQTIDLLLEIKRAFNSQEITELDIIEKYTSATYLVLDDIGVEKRSDWTFTVFYKIINDRYISNLPTIITSNCSLDDLDKHFDERIVSRIIQMCEVIKMPNLNHRLEKG